jgi:hypothetical protein
MNGQNEDNVQVTPGEEGRWSANCVANLWVLKRSWSNDKTHVEVCGVIE